ncbi:hypothetical protein A4X13_0g3926 [Tilletia indica]|uniref:Uncharacterized protein n=1 Tax=Tilletia indica TaxID=43049 RepID=A0A177TK70_9BASI|nr:hypothetical protein A4X13_0g3926 [Tilletia indica]
MTFHTTHAPGPLPVGTVGDQDTLNNSPECHSVTCKVHIFPLSPKIDHGPGRTSLATSVLDLGSHSSHSVAKERQRFLEVLLSTLYYAAATPAKTRRLSWVQGRTASPQQVFETRSAAGLSVA